MIFWQPQNWTLTLVLNPMRMLRRLLLLSVAGWARLVDASFTTTTGCFVFVGTTPIPISSDFPNCNYMSNAYSSCNSGPSSALNACICNQNLLNAIYG